MDWCGVYLVQNFLFLVFNPLLLVVGRSFDDGGMWIKQNWPSSCVRFHFMSKTNVYPAGPVLEPLSAPQPTFEHDGWTSSNCSLLHKLLITGQGEQVVSRRGELNGGEIFYQALLSRARRVGVFYFGTGWVGYLQKSSGTGTGRVG